MALFVLDFVGHDVRAGVGCAYVFEVFIGLKAGVIVADTHLEVGFVVDEVGAGVGKQCVEGIAGAFGLRAGVHPREGGNLDSEAVEFAHFLPIVYVILLDFGDARLDVVAHVPLRGCGEAERQEQEDCQQFTHNQIFGKNTKFS